jgi:hypothetical protein
MAPCPPALSQSIRAVWAKVNSTTGLPFPQTVGALLALGVTRYHIDYLSSTATAYHDSGAVDVAEIPSHLPSGVKTWGWDQPALRAAIKRVQGGETPTYAQFSRECIEAGATNYFACLAGKRVVYMSGLGDFHVEWFPGSEPKQVN